MVTRRNDEITYRGEVTKEMLEMTGEELEKHIRESYGAKPFAVAGKEGTELYSKDIKLRAGEALLVSSPIKPTAHHETRQESIPRIRQFVQPTSASVSSSQLSILSPEINAAPI
jgi:hypothetical protein